MPSRRSRRQLARAITTLAGACALLVSAAALPAQADSPITPTDSVITVSGAGWGHGRGMSQYGANRAAKAGLSAAQILGFYYTGTTLGGLSNGNQIRVWISGDTDAKLHVRPAVGQVVTDSAGTTVTLPVGRQYTKWRIARSGSKRVLTYRNRAGRYVSYPTQLAPGKSWSIANPATGVVKLAMPNGSTRSYSGTLALSFTKTSAITVNSVTMETYLRSVVPAEMPAEWASEALKAQAVAARTYAAKQRAAKPAGSAYDICDTSSCQVYKDNSARQPRTDAAIAATANVVVLARGQLALTEFTSSNGGWTAGSADTTYLTAKQDPYDPVRTWSKTISTAALRAAYPSIGAFGSIQVSARADVGPYNGQGRVATIKITGSAGSVSVSGRAFKSAFGLKETLFTISANQVVTTKS